MVRIFTDTRNYELQAFGVPVNIQWNKLDWSGVECSGVKLAVICGGKNTGKRRSWYAEAEKVFNFRLVL